MIKGQKGMALPIVLVSMFVLTLLGVALLQYGVSDAVQVSKDQQRMQAYYLARSGADAVAQHILNNPSQAAPLISADKSSPVVLGNGTFEVLVYGNPNSEVLIESVGTVGNVTQKAVLSVVKMSLFDVALAGNSINISGNSARIYGNVVYRNSISVASSVIPSGWSATQDTTLSYPPATFPSDAGLALIPVNGNMVFSGHQTENITVDSRGSLIHLNNNNHTLNIYLGSSTYQDRVLKVSTVRLNGGKIILHGKGRLLLYVDTFEGGGNFQTSPGSDASIMTFVSNGGTFNMNGTPEYTGGIYAPQATVNLQGNVSYTGSIVADSILGGGNATVTYKALNTSDLPIPLYLKGVWR